MPRRKKSDFKREISDDPVYQSELVHKLINVVMWRGKKNVARSIVYDAFDIVGKKVGGDKDKTFELFYKAFVNIVPLIEVRARRVGGSVYQIPMEVKKQRGEALGLRWLVKAASSRPAKTMAQRLAQEVIEASEGRGGAVGEKINREKMAKANRAYSHYVW